MIPAPEGISRPRAHADRGVGGRAPLYPRVMGPHDRPSGASPGSATACWTTPALHQERLPHDRSSRGRRGGGNALLQLDDAEALGLPFLGAGFVGLLLFVTRFHG